MSDSQLVKWLESVKLHQYVENFTSNQVDYETLKYLDEGILKDLGIFKIGDRIKLELEIRKLKDQNFVKTLKIKDLFQQVRASAKPLQLTTQSSGTLLPSTASEFKLEMPPAARPGKASVSFILQNGSTVKIHVNGCFNATSIKKKLIKFLDLPNKSPSAYDTYLTDKQGNLHLLFDVELVTICHSNDRIEKNRILFCLKSEEPSDMALEVSKKYISMEPKPEDENPITEQGTAVIATKPSQDQKFRKVFGQRPSSQLISTNLAEYFPETNQEKLQKTIRNSVRHSIRMSTFATVSRKSTIGDFLVDNNQKIDKARLSMSNINTLDSLNLQSSMDQTKQRFSIATSIGSDRTSKIELFDLDSDSDSDEVQEDITASLSSNLQVSKGSSGPTNWLKGARIGSGSFGTVYLGMHAHSGELMAVKQVELRPLFDDAEKGTNDPKNNRQVHQKIVEALEHEMVLLSELQHENIVTYLGSSADEDYLNIFLEYVPGGSLNTMLTNYGPFEEPLIRNFTRQILIGISYLHSKNIIHRDIKGANILIDIKGEVKISDFGISKKLAPKDKDKRASLQGSVYWMAPEIVKQIATTPKADIWSVGCLIIEMFTGKHPFPNFSQMQAIFKIGTHNTPEIPKWCTPEAKDFLSRCFILDYTKRPSAQELLNHSFLDSLIINQ